MKPEQARWRCGWTFNKCTARGAIQNCLAKYQLLIANCYLHIRLAWPLSIRPSLEVALIITGLMVDAVQVALTWPLGEAVSMTVGSFAVQLEVTSAAVAVPIHPLPTTMLVAENIWLFDGGMELWFTVADAGVIVMPIDVQLLFIIPPQPVRRNVATERRGREENLSRNIVRCSLFHNSTPVEMPGNVIL
jgi:hypothetical protein